MSLPGQPKPSQPPTDGGKPRAQFPAPFIFDAVIEGLAYHLPSPGEPAVEIMLIDGSFAQLFASKVIMRGQILNIPSGIANAQPISVGGQSITAQPGTAKKPDLGDPKGGKGGGGGFLDSIKKIGNAIESAAKALGGAAKGAADFASGAAGASASTAASTFKTAVSGANDVVSTLNGIQKEFPLESLSEAGMDTFTSALNKGRDSLNTIQALGKMLENFDALKPDVQKQVRDKTAEHSKPDGIIQRAGEAMKAFSDFPWETEVPKTDVSSTTSSSSSVKPTPTEEAVQYFIITKPGTSLQTFKNFTKELDGGIGQAETYDMKFIDHQTYLTSLNRSVGDGLQRKYPFLEIAAAWEADPMDYESTNEFFRTTHGTKMAIIAGGKKHGISPQADLYLLKVTGTFNTGDVPRRKDSAYAIQGPALSRVLAEVRRHIESRLARNPNAKSVINMSWGVSLQRDGSTLVESTLRSFFEWCERLKVTVVVAAGNIPEGKLHQTIPQKFGTPDNVIITVGGVIQDGTLYLPTTLHEPGQLGSMSVFAPAENIEVPVIDVLPPGGTHSGTSQAAAITSGMIAYLFSVPGLNGLHRPGVPQPQDNIKQFVIEHAWTRVSNSQIGKLTSLDVIYNLARGDGMHTQNPCVIHFPPFDLPNKRDIASVSACSAIQSYSSSRSLSVSAISSK
ncbi:peptidase S8/S53 domain-containing protein [Phaeosphaeriaceae sp. PMI808]|nr:peptidase S8/S53 domain-containing protein [Phaeosphaeriaceae sp. PMI808]